ncbi:MAG: hypothetical protein A2007_00335 [Verrucomicrobia bacterium GWC2_42_7]|nr:MAG: hypothetical protein A2007_00335 [Verrucomicrobia bacterium GWC2_42_7]
MPAHFYEVKTKEDIKISRKTTFGHPKAVFPDPFQKRVRRLNKIFQILLRRKGKGKGSTRKAHSPLALIKRKPLRGKGTVVK